MKNKETIRLLICREIPYDLLHILLTEKLLDLLLDNIESSSSDWRSFYLQIIRDIKADNTSDRYMRMSNLMYYMFTMFNNHERSIKWNTLRIKFYKQSMLSKS